MLRAVLFAIVCLLMEVMFTPLALLQNDDIDFTRPGIYGVGEQMTSLIDISRDNRELPIYVWYPSEPPSRQKSVIVPKADLPIYDVDGPYPLVIFSVGACLSANNTNKIAPHLVSHGFIVISAQHAEVPESLEQCADEDPSSVVNRPMDISFILDEIEAERLLDISLLIDLTNVGVAGYSYGAYAALVSGGANVDSTALSEFCMDSNDMLCGSMLDAWDSVTVLYQSLGTTTDGMWVDLVDNRIDAIATTAPCFVPFLNLDEMNTPMLLFSVENDMSCPAERDAMPLFENSVASERFWLHWTGRHSAPGWPQHQVFYNERDVMNSVVAVESAFFYSYLYGDNEFESRVPAIIETYDDWIFEIGS